MADTLDIYYAGYLHTGTVRVDLDAHRSYPDSGHSNSGIRSRRAQSAAARAIIDDIVDPSTCTADDRKGSVDCKTSVGSRPA